MVIYPIEISLTPSSGTISTNTLKLESRVIKQIIIEAATSTTTFKFDIKDEKGLTVFNTETAATGKLLEEVDIPAVGIYTLRIYESSSDELFTGRVMVQEC